MLRIARDCPIEQGCSAWIFKYLKDCVCNSRDAASFAFGLVSVISWGIAEVPQIITNYKEKSTEGVSLLFLMTWVIGDFFNLAGCLLEPATLPTQFYMALLYTITTIVLVLQTVYYGRKAARKRQAAEEEPLLLPEQKKPQALAPPPSRPDQSTLLEEAPAPSRPLRTISVPSPQRKKYFTSARSLTSSHTPTAGSYLLSASARHGLLASNTSLSNLQAAEAAHEPAADRPGTAIARAVATTGLFVLAGFGLHSGHFGQPSEAASGVVYGRRRLLQEGDEHSQLGEMFGWAMAAIYMGGRLPQIWLNIARGTVEGLNPMMFFFALMGNAFYVASILVRSCEWKKIKPNMPWLVDAAVCVLLDFFILSQFCYYCFVKKRRCKQDEECK